MLSGIGLAGLFVFLIYWIIILAIARYPGDLSYSGDGYERSDEIKPTPTFSRREKVSITIVCFSAVAVNLLALLFFGKELNSVLIPTLKIYGEIVMGGFVGCLSVGCFALLFAPLWFVVVSGVSFFVFIFLPAKILQGLGLFFANR